MSTVASQAGLDPTLPDVSLILGGVERHLVFDFNAIVQAEKATGVNLLKAIVGDIDATRIRGLLWAALLRENPKLAIEEVGAWLRPANISAIHQALIAAWFGSVDDVDAKDAAAGEGEAQTIPTV